MCYLYKKAAAGMLEFTTVVSDLSSIFRYLLALRGFAVLRF
jgi:hypothetical protein